MLILLLAPLAQAEKIPVPTWDAMPSLAPPTIASEQDLERALEPYRISLFEPKRREGALWIWVVFDDKKEDPATWAVHYRYDRVGESYQLTSVQTYGDKGPAAPVATDEPLPVEYLVAMGTLNGDYGTGQRACLRTVRDGWCSVFGGSAVHVQLTPGGRERLVEAELLGEWPPFLSRVEAASPDEAAELMRDHGFLQDTGLFAHHYAAELRIAELMHLEPPAPREPEPPAAPRPVAPVDKHDLAAILGLPQVRAMTADTCGDGTPVPGTDLCDLPIAGIREFYGHLYGRFDRAARAGAQRDVWLVFDWGAYNRLPNQLNNLDVRNQVRGVPDHVAGVPGLPTPTGWSWSAPDKASGRTRYVVVGGNPTRVAAIGTAPLPGTVEVKSWGQVQDTLAAAVHPELASWANALLVLDRVPEGVVSAAESARAGAPPNTVEPSTLRDWLPACGIPEERWTATLAELPLIAWDRDRWALNPTLTDDDTCEQLNLVVGLVEDPLAHTVDEAERAGRFLREDNGYLAVPLAGPIVDRRIEMALARSLIGEAFAAEDERARLAEGVHNPTVTRPGAALRAFAEAFMPGWPEGTGVEDPTGQPRSTRPELQTTLEPGEVRPWPDDNCVATRAQDSKSVTRTVTVSGQAGSQAAKDRLYAIQREMDSLELQLQRLGERRQVTDYLVERDGTVRSGLVTQDSPQHDHLERKLAELRAEQGQLMEAAIGTLPTERTITEQVKGDVYEQMVCTGRALQGGTLAVGNDTMPVDRTRRETLSARRAPGDAAAMARLNDAATAAALANIGEAEWDLLGGMRVLDWMAIDRWILSRGLQNQWTPEERESERQFLRDHYHPRAGNQAD